MANREYDMAERYTRYEKIEVAHILRQTREIWYEIDKMHTVWEIMHTVWEMVHMV